MDSLEAIGACKRAAAARTPFFWGFDMAHSPLSMLWIQRDRPPRPLVSGEWAEVTHCGAQSSAELRQRRVERYRGLRTPFWAYGAPGSGVSINVGRTLVASNWSHAVELLHGAFGQRDAHGRGTSPTAGGRALLAAYTSVQIVNHNEFYAGSAPRHEIVMLHWREWESLAALATAGTRDAAALSRPPPAESVRCGRHPHLFACGTAHLRRFAHCGNGAIRGAAFAGIGLHSASCHDDEASSAPPAPPPTCPNATASLPPEACVQWRARSRAVPCEHNVTFGCCGDAMWVAGCRGDFRCGGGKLLRCGDPFWKPGRAAHWCSCVK